MNAAHRYIEVNGQTLHVKEWSEAGPLVLLLHHMTGSSDDWDDVAPELADEFHVVAVDLRGRGFSSKPSQGYHWADDLAEDVAQMMPLLSEERAVLIGHSMGGMVAVLAAAKAKERVAALVLEDPPLYDQQPHFTHDFWRSKAAYHSSPLEAKVEYHLSRGLPLHEALPMAERHHRLAPAALEEYIAGKCSYDHTEWLPRVKCPSLLMLGEHGVVSAEDRRALLDLYSFTRVTEWTGFGHGLHEDAARFVSEVKDFLSECGVSGVNSAGTRRG